MFFTEPPVHSKINRAKLAESMFENFGFSQMFICKSPVLSSFSCGKSTCLVFDSGDCSTYAVPVHDGYIVQSTIFKCKVAGNVLTDSCNKYLNSQGIQVVPEVMMKTVVKAGRLEKERVELPGFTESAQKLHILKILKKFKSEVLAMSEIPLAKRDITYGFESKIYWLPDGSAVELKGEQYKIPEVLFMGSSAPAEESKQQEDENGDVEMKQDDSYCKALDGFSGFQSLLKRAINASDMDIRRDLYKNILCTGGTTQMKGFEQRFKHEVQEIAPQNCPVEFITKTRMPIPGVDSNDFFTAWIGASILSSLGSFKSLWFTKKEYDENGAYYIEKKCP